MKKSCGEIDFYQYDVIDLTIEKRIEGIRWADDKTGEYEVCQFDQDGRIKLGTGEDGSVIMLTEKKQGEIEFRRKMIYQSPTATHEQFIRSEDLLGRD